MSQESKIWRIHRRWPIAIFMFFLFALMVWADITWAGMTTGLVFVPMFMLAIAFMAKGKGASGLRLYNRLFYPYVGRNNYLWLWMCTFPLTFWFFFWILGDIPEGIKARIEQISNPIVAGKIVQETPEQAFARKMQEEQEAITKKYDRYRAEMARPIIEAAQQTKTEKQETSGNMTPNDVRVITHIIIWVIAVFYLFFAFSDEFKAAWKRKEQAWFDKSEGVSNPAMYEAIRKFVGVEGPSLLTKAVVTGAAGAAMPSMGKLSYFLGQVFTEVFAEGVANKAFGRGRR